MVDGCEVGVETMMKNVDDQIDGHDYRMMRAL